MRLGRVRDSICAPRKRFPLPADQDLGDKPLVSLRQPAMAAATAMALGYGILALLLPHPLPTFDEAKYLAIGVNALSGHGPRTAFGELFLAHSPYWPMLFAAPQVALGQSPWAWGHLLNAIAASGTLLLAGWLARPFGPRAVLLTVAALVGWLSLFGLARTARLDVPEAALSLAYIAVARSAVDSGLVRRGILAGVLFAWAFLVKEAGLILLAAPFLAAIAARRPLAATARAGGLVLLTAVPLVAWWFGWYAGTTGRVYALGLGAALLAPLGIALLVLGGALVVLGAPWPPAARLTAWAGRRLQDRRTALAVAGLLVGAWAVAFLVAFSQSSLQAGRPLLDLPNLARWGRAWLADLGPILLVGVGLVGAVRSAWRGDDRPLHQLVVLVAGIPWLLLVAVQGEPPRNDIALLAIAASAGAAGWLQLPRLLEGRDRAIAVVGAAVGASLAVAAAQQLARQAVAPGLTAHLRGVALAVVLGAAVGAAATSPAARRWARERLGAAGRPSVELRGVAVVLVAALSVSALGAALPRMASAAIADSRPGLPDEIAAWIGGHLPVGSTVAFGSVLANETALRLDGRYQLRSLQATLGVVDAAAPLGIRVGDEQPADLVSVDRHPRQSGFYVFTARQVGDALSADRPAVWVYVTGQSTSAPSLVAWLATVPGVRLATVLSAPTGADPTLQAHVFWVDLAGVAVPDTRTFASADALNALLDGLGSAPQAPGIATTLLGRVATSDAGPAADAAMARLRSVAGR